MANILVGEHIYVSPNIANLQYLHETSLTSLPFEFLQSRAHMHLPVASSTPNSGTVYLSTTATQSKR